MRRIRICYFNVWAGPLEKASDYLDRVADLELRPLVRNPENAGLMRKARLDCDWYGENLRAFAHLEHPEIEFLPAWVCGRSGILELGRVPRNDGVETWLVTMGHQPDALGQAAGGTFSFLSRLGIRHLFYAFDEASRCMASFNAIAPHLDVLIHDELPLAIEGCLLLPTRCRTYHRSWVANLRPFAVPFHEAPEEKILFLGSELGLTPHRRQQFEHLRRAFGSRFVAIHDHSVGVEARADLNRFKVALCPEGRKFDTPAMAFTHTDRPFWTGCSGMVPVAEDSQTGGRLEELWAAGLIFRYDHGDMASLEQSCALALLAGREQRRRIYEYFNRAETVGSVVAAALAGTSASGNAKAPDEAGALLELAKPVPKDASAGLGLIR